MGSSQLTQQILHISPCVPSFIQTLAEEGVIGISSLTTNSTLQELTYPDYAAILQFQVSLGMEYFVLSIIKNGAEIFHQISKFDQMSGASKPAEK